MIPFPQTALLTNFGRNSCYIFALARAVEILTGKDLLASDVLRVALKTRNVSSNAFVYDAGSFCDEIASLVLGDSKYAFTVSKELQPSIMSNVCNIQHWVLSSNSYSAHHFKLDSWDSVQFMTQAEKLGSIVDYRVVTLLQGADERQLELF